MKWPDAKSEIWGMSFGALVILSLMTVVVFVLVDNLGWEALWVPGVLVIMGVAYLLIVQILFRIGVDKHEP